MNLIHKNEILLLGLHIWGRLDHCLFFATPPKLWYWAAQHGEWDMKNSVTWSCVIKAQRNKGTIRIFGANRYEKWIKYWKTIQKRKNQNIFSKITSFTDNFDALGVQTSILYLQKLGFPVRNEFVEFFQSHFWLVWHLFSISVSDCFFRFLFYKSLHRHFWAQFEFFFILHLSI